MPNPLTSVVLSGTDYTTAATIEGVYGDADGNNGGGWFEVLDNAVFYSCQYAPWQPKGVGRSGFGLAGWTQDAPLSAGPGQIPTNCLGVKFKNQDGTKPATVSAYIAPPGQPTLGLSAPGSVTVAAVSQVTGIIPAAGTTPTAGSGFTYTHTNGTGVYVFTFTTPFANTPTVLANATAINRIVWLTAISTAGFTATLGDSSTLTKSDQPFNFSAVVTV